MKILLFFVIAIITTAPIHANEPPEVRELATTYMRLSNEKQHKDLFAKCIFSEGITDEISGITMQMLKSVNMIQSFNIEKPTDQDKKKFSEGVATGKFGQLYLNLEPLWVIAFSIPTSNTIPTSTLRVFVGTEAGKWRVAMLVPKKK